MYLIPHIFWKLRIIPFQQCTAYVRCIFFHLIHIWTMCVSLLLVIFLLDRWRHQYTSPFVSNMAIKWLHLSYSHVKALENIVWIGTTTCDTWGLFRITRASICIHSEKDALGDSEILHSYIMSCSFQIDMLDYITLYLLRHIYRESILLAGHCRGNMSA